ncbi:cytochrome c oxidase assembly protein [Salicibibacter kimchii]|uniref:Cytochrome c oxidase assembly protein n=1 Tax=Salicibibacter kimchii TaxID=2099786 RepID=A0A345C1Q5_9BACI|nr:cytochrome c oxidase assembly protein [Salicibibacter kimchii]AXF57136.1 cytochrome c oxidase assembly protein [Salicibibacter kimchii]
MQNHHPSVFVEWVLVFPFLAALIVYTGSFFISRKKGRKWPAFRTIFWFAGVFLCLISVAGPIAHMAQVDFRIHMAGHLFLGMLGPLLMALGAPVKLLLRSLSIQRARSLTRILRSRVLGFLSNPAVTAALNIGGLCVLYTTDLFRVMHESPLLHVVIHLHIFLAGYLFTVSLIYVEPISHRTSYLYRSIILVFALTAHGILSKYIYARPPESVSADEAEAGGMLMYYGGDAVDLMIIIILCYHWYRATTPKETGNDNGVLV